MLERVRQVKIREQSLEDIGIMPKYTSTGRAGDIVKCVNNHGLYMLLVLEAVPVAVSGSLACLK